MSSRTTRLPSVLTTTLVTKLSIAKLPRAGAGAPRAAAGTRASARASAAARRPMRSAPECDARDLTLFGALELEVLPPHEPEEQRDLVGRKAVDRRVQIADDGVVVAARALDGLLELAERLLEVLIALVCFEVGIRFGEREELTQRPG